MDAGGWATLAAASISGGGIGAGVRPVLDYWKGRRRQTDEVAMGLVEKLQGRIERLEADQVSERQLCDAKLSVLRHELKNVQGNFDALLLAIEVAPEKAAEVVARIKTRRQKAEEADRVGEARQAGQIVLSATNLARDER